MNFIQFYCENISKELSCEYGQSLKSIIASHFPDKNYCMAYVDNTLKELSYKINFSQNIRFLDFSNTDAYRANFRSLCLVLQSTVAELFPQYDLIIDYNLPNGFFATLNNSKDSEQLNRILINDVDIQLIEARMRAIIASDEPIIKNKLRADEAEEIFRANRREDKAAIVQQLGRFYVSVYELNGYKDTFYGPMLDSTKWISDFRLMAYNGGFCIQLPKWKNGSLTIDKYVEQEKLSKVFEENSNWLHIIGASRIASLNKAVLNGDVGKVIQIAEGLHERKYAEIADMIYARKEKLKLVLISGPSSSGKTTTSNRVALQCRVLGLNPVVLAMDNYFVNREHTPLDSDGNYNFESIHAVDVDFINQQLSALFNGETVEIPKFDFIKGQRYFDGDYKKLKDNDILIMEGIHALNPEFFKLLDPERIFKIYASALTSLSIDENNNISTTTNRQIRRMVRDYKHRGRSPEDTILGWASVRRGEINNIFPFQEYADVTFNSAMLYELSVLKYYVEPLLTKISPRSEAYPEATRLLKFLSLIIAINPEDHSLIPPTSVMREFIGGSVFDV